MNKREDVFILIMVEEIVELMKIIHLEVPHKQ